MNCNQFQKRKKLHKVLTYTAQFLSYYINIYTYFVHKKCRPPGGGGVIQKLAIKVQFGNSTHKTGNSQINTVRMKNPLYHFVTRLESGGKGAVN